METAKRKFYGSGSAKGFTKLKFYQAVADLAAGDEVDDDLVALVAAAAAYEIEGIENKASTASTGEKKDPLLSDYAQGLRKAIYPLLNANPQTAEELANAATAKGQLSPKGTPWANVWVARVLSADAKDGKVVKSEKIVTVKKGELTNQKPVSAYARV